MVLRILRNKKNGLGIYVQTLPGQKKPSLLIFDEIGCKKAADFINNGDAKDFIKHLALMVGVEVEDG